jgi:hypothetical protein
MVSLEETISMPLVITEHGTIRIKGSRVSLDSIVHHLNWERQPSKLSRAFLLSASAMSTQVLLTTSHIAKKLKSICRGQETAADALQEQLESNPDYQAEIAELRSRMSGRWTAAQENGAATQLYGTI